MDIEKIKGHSYYIKGGTNSGIYLFKDKYALIVDPGLSNSRGHRLIKLLEEKNIKIKYILITHEHSDHYGASKVLMDYYKGSNVFASKDAKVFIDNPYLFSTYIYGGKSNSFLDNNFKNNGEILTDVDVINSADVKLNNIKFKIVDLKGHSTGSIGIITDDKVLYLGDALFNESILKKYNLPFLFDIGAQIDTLNKIKELDFEYAVLSHGNALLDKEEILKLVDVNEAVINKYLKQIEDFLGVPNTLENLLKDIIEYNDLKLNYKEYHFSKSTLSSMLSYLESKGKLEYEMDGLNVYYYIK